MNRLSALGCETSADYVSNSCRFEGLVGLDHALSVVDCTDEAHSNAT